MCEIISRRMKEGTLYQYRKEKKTTHSSQLSVDAEV